MPAAWCLLVFATTENGRICALSRGLLSTNLTLLSCLLQLPISLRMDLLLTAGEHVLRRDVANSPFKRTSLYMFHVAVHQAFRILERQRVPGRRHSTLATSANVRFFRSIEDSRRSSDVGHAGDPNKLLEVFGNELRPVVGDDPGPRFGVKFLGAQCPQG